MEKDIDGIFLDTNVFESAKFEYHGNNIETLFRLCEKYNFPIYIDEIVEREVINRIIQNAEDAIQGLKTDKLKLIARVASIQTNKNEIKIALEEKMKSDFFVLLESTITRIPTNFNQNILIGMYFNSIAPFNVDNKKSEFPDAMIALSIKEFAEQHKKNILMIPNDNGMTEFCLNNKISTANVTSHALNILNEQLQLNKFYTRFEEVIQEKVVDSIISYDVDFEFSGYTFNYDDIEADYEMNTIHFNRMYLLNEDEVKMTLSVACEVSIDFVVKTHPFPDYENALHDKEDDVWFTYGNMQIEFKHNEVLELTFDVNVLNFQEGKLEVSYSGQSNIIDFDPFNIDDNDIIGREYLSNE